MEDIESASSGAFAVLNFVAYGRAPIARARDGYFHPSNEDELIALVRAARREGKQLRVRGSAHSVRAAIYTDDALDRLATPRHLDVMLDRYVGVYFDDATMTAVVEAGCHLGFDPRDPTRTSRWDDSLLAKLEARGWAVPDLGGVTHQTVAGFLATGSHGGTLQHSFASAVVAIRVIHADGSVREYARGRDELFDAMLCSLGLLGVVSTVTLRCEPRYDVMGREDIRGESDCDYRLYEDGDEGLAGFLRRAEYARLMWWPQHGVRRVVTWQARRMLEADYDSRTGPRGALRAKPYRALGDTFENARVARAADLGSQAVAGAFFDAVAAGARARAHVDSTPLKPLADAMRGQFERRVLPAVIRAFVPEGSSQEFWNSWCHGLPMDNDMSERSLPTEFTELWLPLDRCGAVLRAMRAHYDEAGLDATGTFICELYGAPSFDAWLHPGYGRESIRVDLFWFGRNHGDPVRGYFRQFWELLAPFEYRLHWGKHLPREARLGHQLIRRSLPRWNDFMTVRRDLDPSGVFLSTYWRDQLGL